ncbi:hypothetical protein [Candidatus Palauibacter sp.]|uniref:hypothetical protein n=1 Tax=Candidatus Palauibacter sp. TaxID=3101350 RepID=UPI003B01CA6E
MSVLEATHRIVIVPPYLASFGERLVKMPKVYFSETGTLRHLASGMRTARRPTPWRDL